MRICLIAPTSLKGDVCRIFKIYLIDSTVGELSEMIEKFDDSFSEQLKILDDMESTETEYCKHIVYIDPK